MNGVLLLSRKTDGAVVPFTEGSETRMAGSPERDAAAMVAPPPSPQPGVVSQLLINSSAAGAPTVERTKTRMAIVQRSKAVISCGGFPGHVVVKKRRCFARQSIAASGD